MKQRNLLIAIAGFAAAQLLFSCSPSGNEGFAKRKYYDYKWDKKEYAKVESDRSNAIAPETLSPNDAVIAMNEPQTEAPAADMKITQLPQEPVKTAPAPVKKHTASPAAETKPVVAKEEKMSFTEKFMVRKIEKMAEKQQQNESQRVETILLVILAILIPPLAVYLAKGIGTEFWISLILTLLFFIPGIIYALIVVLS
jgi:uncharacterized membrane protein YqaE (UPF0057 family)